MDRGLQPDQPSVGSSRGQAPCTPDSRIGLFGRSSFRYGLSRGPNCLRQAPSRSLRCVTHATRPRASGLRPSFSGLSYWGPCPQTPPVLPSAEGRSGPQWLLLAQKTNRAFTPVVHSGLLVRQLRCLQAFVPSATCVRSVSSATSAFPRRQASSVDG